MPPFDGILCDMAATPESVAINVSLPSTMRSWVEQVVSTGGYGSVSEYVRELIRADQKRRAQERLEGLLIEGLERGPGVPATPELWANRRADLLNRLQKRGTTR